MIKFTDSKYALLQDALGQISLSTENNLQRAERSYEASRKAMQQLKEFILDYEFKDKAEEILFFKEIKPIFLKELIYYMELFYIEAGKPVGNIEALRSFYKAEAERITMFFDRNQVFYIYHRMGKTNLDNIYFARDTDENDLTQPEYLLDIDARFSTVYSFKLAKILALEQLNQYLQTALYELDHPKALVDNTISKLKDFGLNWAETKVSLIELIYALHVVGAFYNVKTHTKADVKDIARFFESCLNIDLGDSVYRSFYDIRLRKKEPTPFIKKLDHELINYIDQVNS
jgi:hypothetical protein